MMPQKVFFGMMGLAKQRAMLLFITMALGVLIAGGLAVSLGTQPAEAAFPGHNGPIAFVKGKTIKLVDTNGTVRTSLRIGGNAYSPEISPNGRKVAYSKLDGSISKGDVEIYTINIATRKIRKITNNTVTDDAPTWSPDGARIAFMRNTGYYSSDIFIERADGTGKAIKVNTPAEVASPAWSPNGKEIAFTRIDMFVGPAYDIFVKNLATGQTRNLTKDEPAHSVNPDWSPNGTRIAFVSGTNIYTVSASDGSSRRLLASGGVESPNYSPDGSRMVYVHNEPASAAIWTMNASDGSAKKAILSGRAYGFGDIDWGVRARRR